MTDELPVPPDSAPCPRGHPNEPDAGQCSTCGVFLRANTMALVHGSRQGRALEATVADSLAEVDDVLAGGPGSEDRYRIARVGAASALARVRLMTAYLDRNGWLDHRGTPRKANQLLEKAEATLLAYLRELGCTPAAASRLGLNLSRTRLTLAEQIQAERRARQVQQ